MTYQVGGIDVLQRSLSSNSSPTARYEGLEPGETILPAGFRKSSAHRPFRVSTIYERDIQIPLRDGTIIRADVFRPEDSQAKVPALMSWSPYGKSGTGFFNLDLVPGRVGVPQSRLSGFESFEAPDPAEWTARGYAIVNVNSRGAFDSGGDIKWWGTAEGRDGYDAIEHLATLSWCSGRISMIGNSWLGAVQWFIAAEKPPHLTCIAPLEGFGDLYREILCRGGVPYLPFLEFLASSGLFGNNQQEDVIAMLEKYPFVNGYWEDKRAKIGEIDIPAYILASYSTGLHTVGSFRGFEDIKSQDKWLRVHPTQEWHDLYSTQRIEELQQFFDYFLKGKANGWRDSPRVLLSTLCFNKDPEIGHVLQDWPAPNTDYRTFHLSHDYQLITHAPSTSATFSYQSDAPSMQMDTDSEELSFEFTLPSRSHIVGYSKAIIYMSCPEHDDLDVFVQLRKADKNGSVLQNINIPLKDLGMEASEVITTNTNRYIGPTGILRASRRKIDPQHSKPHWAIHEHVQNEKVTPGEIVKLEIGIWPSGITFEAGEKLIFKIAGHQMTLAEFEPLRGGFLTGNKGRHIVHSGPEYPSQVIIPFVKL